MTRFLVMRSLQSLLVVLGAITLVFVVLRVAPGDPAVLYAGPQATAADIAAAREALGLDQSIFVQYLRFLGNVVSFDFGDSYRLHDSALGLLADRIPATLLLACAAITIAVVVGFILGVWAGLTEGKWSDSVISSVSLFGQAAPNFWIGIVLILVLSANFRLLPSSGFGSPNHLLMPAVTLALPLIGLVTRLVRAGLIDVLQQPYIRAARARGYTPAVVVWRHAMRNTLIPVVTVIGLQMGNLLGGAVIVETVFAWPGIGRLLVDAIFHRDYPLVQAAILFITASFIFINLLVDISYVYLDPRISLR
jgi:ABC-type dipeptide/oligopeptide/nickel transport system permease component